MHCSGLVVAMCAVKATIGVCWSSFSSALIFSVASKPSMIGIFMSMTMRSYICFLKASTASSPF